jgi:hypothetical protein
LWPTAITTEAVFGYIFASLFAVFGGLVFWSGIRVLISPPTVLVIDTQGITVDPKRSKEFIPWSDLKGAHLAVVESGAGGVPKPGMGSPIVALELVDPQALYTRLDADKPRWLGRDTGMHPNHYRIYCGNLDAKPSRLLDILDEGIRRQGRPNPDPAPQTVYQPFFHRSPTRRGFALGVAFVAVLLSLFVAVVVLVGPPTWVAAGASCEVRNLYRGKQWKQAKTTTASWTGPCIGGRADGSGVLEWFRNGVLAVRYVGEMSGGRMTGRGESTEWGILNNGVWKDGQLQDGTATYPDGRRFEGRWYKGRWTKGVLTAPAGRRLEGRWYEGRLTGRSVAEGPEGRYDGNWTYGVPEGTGTFVTADGRRYDGKWRDGIPVDPEVARLQALQGWDCLWDIASRRFGDGFPGVGSARCRAK